MKIRVSKSYGEKKVLDRLELDVREGEILCLLGASGSGKTTLLNILAGLTQYEGEVENLPKKVGYIFQEPRLLPNLTVVENLRYAGGRDEFIDEILQKIGLAEHREKRPSALSGGEKQRVAIARAFLSDSPLLLLDEPFSSLDTALKIRLSEVFAEHWREQRRTAIFVTHNVEEAWMLAHRVVMIKDGKAAMEIPILEGEIPRKFSAGGAVKEKIVNALLGVEQNS
jgi:sulfonate transport system ATP-binding protein